MWWVEGLLRRGTAAAPAVGGGGGGGGGVDWLGVLLLLGWTRALTGRGPSSSVARWGVLV